MPRRRLSVDDSGGSTADHRCQHTVGRRWRCPLPALSNVSFCKSHIASQKGNSNSELQNPNLKPQVSTNPDPQEAKIRAQDPAPRRGRPRKENGKDPRDEELDQSSDHPSPELMPEESDSDSDSEGLNQPLALLVAKSKKRRREEVEEEEPEHELEVVLLEELPEEVGEKVAAVDADPVAEDLIRMEVKRQMERREEREEIRKSQKLVEVKRALPNGVMEISPKLARDSSNGERVVNKRVGVGLVIDEGCGWIRRCRSKNVEPEPIGPIKEKCPKALGKSRRKRKISHQSKDNNVESTTGEG